MIRRGTTLCIMDLPKADHERWMPTHKKLVIRAIAEGVVSLQWAMDRYSMHIDEYLEWRSHYEVAPQKKGSMSPLRLAD